ncbi:MAG: hypothetical protein QW255_04600 [Candidatus Bilamarchaeaceae archaeon]
MNFDTEIKRLQIEKDIFSLKAAICDTKKSKLNLLKQIEQIEQKIAEWEQALNSKEKELEIILTETTDI